MVQKKVQVENVGERPFLLRRFRVTFCFLLRTCLVFATSAGLMLKLALSCARHSFITTW
jgi:hypothetical protein